MEIEITSLFAADSSFVPFDCSNNRATLGDNAGELTWAASKEAATKHVLLDTPEKLQAMRDFLRATGAWDEEEIAAWSDSEINALFLQWVAGDVRELFGDDDPADWDWAEAQKDQESGRKSGNVFRGDSGKLYFYLGS